MGNNYKLPNVLQLRCTSSFNSTHFKQKQKSSKQKRKNNNHEPTGNINFSVFTINDIYIPTLPNNTQF